ncbi:hypothetical protein [Dendronalium sp. ChiSLP03b]|uniref:hypothetical protein n=1 Tax=Dendronalium sp. ChiSLP03b TaxID=3075381 RepID=UPI002AD53EB4|nr:hypothetical protein [Dendronalium sp. ChiSLP03b]MDZ8208251.1 hypothetical protein [Dendronalium sp. ChiSLP03b]
MKNFSFLLPSAICPSGDAPNVANAALTAVAHGGNPQDRTASPPAFFKLAMH